MICYNFDLKVFGGKMLNMSSYPSILSNFSNYICQNFFLNYCLIHICNVCLFIKIIVFHRITKNKFQSNKPAEVQLLPENNQTYGQERTFKIRYYSVQLQHQNLGFLYRCFIISGTIQSLFWYTNLKILSYYFLVPFYFMCKIERFFTYKL